MIKEWIKKSSFKAASFLNEAEGGMPKRINREALAKALSIDASHFSALLPYRYFDEEYNVFVNEHSLGFGLELAPLAGADESIIESLSNLLKNKIPASIDVQFILWGNNKVGALIDQSTSKQAELGGIFEKMSLLSNRYFKQAAKDSFYNKRKLPLSLRDYRCFCFISKETGYSESAMKGLQELRETLQTEFKASSMTTVSITLEGFLNILPNILMPEEADLYPKFKTKISEHTPINEELLCRA
jgi:conjugal transfer ATP-binding protein TraC